MQSTLQSQERAPDPLFYLVTAIAVIMLGLSKGGFFGLGVMGLPLMSLYVPPLQAAAILIPVVLAQDVLTIWTYRRTWSAWSAAGSQTRRRRASASWS